MCDVAFYIFVFVFFFFKQKTAYEMRISDWSSDVCSSDLGRLGNRFRGFLPVVVDVETGGFECERHALLEIAAQLIEVDGEGYLVPGKLISTHVEPFAGSEKIGRAHV